MERKSNGILDDATEGSEGASKVEGIDPAEFFGEVGDGVARNEDGSVKLRKDGKPAKRRGRKPGDRSERPARKARAVSASAQSAAIETFATAISGIHWLVAAALGADEFKMTDEQAEKVARSVDRVLRAYEVPRNEKVESVVELSAVLGSHYFSAAIRFNTRKKLEARAARAEKKEPAQNITPFNGARVGPGAPNE